MAAKTKKKPNQTGVLRTASEIHLEAVVVAEDDRN
jgi:hypothetical protein